LVSCHVYSCGIWLELLHCLYKTLALDHKPNMARNISIPLELLAIQDGQDALHLCPASLHQLCWCPIQLILVHLR
jgi:hypothetical protein